MDATLTFVLCNFANCLIWSKRGPSNAKLLQVPWGCKLLEGRCDHSMVFEFSNFESWKIRDFGREGLR